MSENKVTLVKPDSTNPVATITANGALSRQWVAKQVNKEIDPEVAIFWIDCRKWVIRRMTVLENCLLMGFIEYDLSRLINEDISYAQANQLFGNSIVINVLIAIF